MASILRSDVIRAVGAPAWSATARAKTLSRHHVFGDAWIY
jgi:hypothetical protein